MKQKLLLFLLFINFNFIGISANNLKNKFSDKWIVVTTINYPTAPLRHLAKQPGWNLVVVADKKTPQDWYLENCEFLSVERQLELDYKIVKLLPWNHYSRKNIGYLYAIEHGANIIYETDDDNMLYDNSKGSVLCSSDNGCFNYSNIYYLPEKSIINTYKTGKLVVNPYAHFGQPTLWPRGYPLLEISKPSEEVLEQKRQVLSIQQGLVDKDPDVDAIFRLTREPNVFFEQADPVAVPKRTFSPFNTQNTIFYDTAFWGLLIPITTSFRVCDIWRGYVTQRLLWDIGSNIAFIASTAYQERNEHNLLKDFIDEVNLYTKSGELLEFLKNWKSDRIDLQDRILELVKEMVINDFYKKEEIKIVSAWLEDLHNIGYKFPHIIKN